MSVMFMAAILFILGYFGPSDESNHFVRQKSPEIHTETIDDYSYAKRVTDIGI